MDSETLNKLPLCSITGRIIVIDSPVGVDAAIAELRREALIGFDTETRPSFIKGIHYCISLLQLSTRTTAYLFRLQMIGHNEQLKALLEDPSVIKVGLSTHDDFRSLQHWMPCTPKGFIELQQYVKNFGIEDMSLQKIYAIVFNERISKSQQLSNWELNPLTPAQCKYAAIDAWACLFIYYKMENHSLDATFIPNPQHIISSQPAKPTTAKEQPKQTLSKKPRSSRSSRSSRHSRTSRTSRSSSSPKKSPKPTA